MEYTVKVTTKEQFNEVLKYLIKETNTSSSEYDVHSKKTMKYNALKILKKKKE